MNLPTAIESERNYLACCLMRTECFVNRGKIDYLMFYDDIHRMIFRAMEVCFDAGNSTEPMQVVTQLEKTGEFETVGFEYLVELQNLFFSSVGYEEYVKAIIDSYLKRQALQKCFEAQAKIIESEDPASSISQISTELQDIVKDSSEINRKSDHEVLQEIKEYVESRGENGDVTNEQVFTYWDVFDKRIRLERGEMSVITAQQKTGKTALATMLFGQMMYNKVPSAYFCLESPRKQILTRSMSGLTRIPHDVFTKPNLATDQQLKDANTCFEIMDTLTQKYISVYGQECIQKYVSEIRLKMYEVIKKLGKVDFIFIDHFHELEAPRGKRFERKDLMYEENAQQIKNLGIEFNCHVIVLAQLRKLMQGQNKPTIQDIRGGSALQDKAANIWFLQKQPQDIIRDTQIHSFWSGATRMNADFNTQLIYKGSIMGYLGEHQEPLQQI